MWTSVTSFLERYSRFLLIVVLAFAFITRFWRLDYPATYYFDEVYHAVTAKLMVHNDPRAFEWWNPPPEPNTAVDWLHPPLAKYAQAVSMIIFGENSFGWRFSSALFGVFVVYITARLGETLFKNKTIGLIAAFLTSMDGLLLVQSRIAMNDIHVTFFILLSLFFYLQAIEADSNDKAVSSSISYWLPWLKVGTALGLALGSKWSGFFAVLIVSGSELWRGAWFVISQSWTNAIRKSIPALTASAVVMAATRWFVTLLALPAVLYVSSYALMFMQGKDFSHLRELHRQTWAYQTTLKATHSFQSRPFQWWLNDRPVWMYVKYYDNNTVENIYAFGNIAIFWLGAGMSFVTAAWVLGGITDLGQKLALETSTKKARQLQEQALHKFLPLTWLWLCYLAVWLPWQLSPRIMFFYHYAPAVPLMCIALAAWFNKIWHSLWLDTATKLLIVGSALWAVFLVFVIWYPHWTGLRVSMDWAETVYFWRASWK